MSVTAIVMSSYWGRDVKHRHVVQGGRALAVVFPGKNYSAERPLLDYGAKVAWEHGCDLLILEYGYQSARTEFRREEMDIVVEECKAAVLAMPHYEQLLFISKSMGTQVASRVAHETELHHKTSHLYLTPIPDSLPLMRRSRGMVIYGSSDPIFTKLDAGEVIGVEGLKVFRIDDANHSLEVGSVNESLAVLLVIINFYHECFEDADLYM